MRISINLPEELVRRIDKVSDEMYISRSAYVATALSEKLSHDAALARFPDATYVMQDMMKFITSQNDQKKDELMEK